MTDQGELGRFLRARRERVKPAEVGLPAVGVRRTPGLRREELATLAGMSVDYYVRLERGKEVHPSPAVLERLAAALLLTEAETAHLNALAAGAGGTANPRRRPASRTVRPTARLLLEAVRPNPAILLSRTNDLLAANPSGLALFPGLADWPAKRRNLIRYLFLHPAARTLWPDWETMVPRSVGNLRARAGTDPDDPELTALVGELIVKSPDFARLWHRYDVRPRTVGTKVYNHPTVGRMHLDFENMALPDTDGQYLVIYLAAPDTPDHDAITLLDLAADPAVSDTR
ncbi:helix-turn-helix transcriptional regulator [Nocardia arthritidis]|uniref:Helix-turn-helix domain-containing protein n=1 Tax=Nocardia arthritidis TaxID=228602 RepID=A0A6G9YPF8_9NOCA|nr:helix-turn-helix transcriptional regulator [Nocardia arthritidis]QIS15020.1 helix-turn-helix domain-containing protein [Nocardia arthritidis]